MSRFLVTMLAMVIAAQTTARAQPAPGQAEVLFQEGRDLMTAGRFAEACSKLEASQKLEPKVGTLINLAGCRSKMSQLATAWKLLVDAASQTASSTDPVAQQLHTVALDLAQKLEPRLSTLRIEVPADSQIAGLQVSRDGKPVDPSTWNVATPVDGGTYAFWARAPGHVDWSGSVVVGAEHDTKTITIPKLPDVGAAQPHPPPNAHVDNDEPTGRPTNGAHTAVEESSTPMDSTGTWSVKRRLAVGLAAGGVVGLTAGVLLGISSSRSERDAHALCPDPATSCEAADRANSLIQKAHDRSIYADVALGVGAAAAITAGVLWFTGGPTSQGGVAVAPVVSATHAALTLSGRF